jgi:hypothetical protein
VDRSSGGLRWAPSWGQDGPAEGSGSTAPVAGALPSPHPDPGGIHRHRGSAGAEPHGSACRGSGVDRLARSPASSCEAGALPGPAGACRDPGGEKGLLQDVLRLRGGFPLRGREVEAGHSGVLPGRELFPSPHLLPCGPPHPGAGLRTILDLCFRLAAGARTSFARSLPSGSILPYVKC